jgi:hypothetical protein
MVQKDEPISGTEYTRWIYKNLLFGVDGVSPATDLNPGPIKISNPIENNGAIPVNIQDQTSDSVNLYLHTEEATPSLNVDALKETTTITVDSVTNISIGDAITIYEGMFHYQSIIVGINGNNIVLSTSLDRDFTTDASIIVGKWNLNLNGSSTPINAYIWAPPTGSFDIYELICVITDNSDMDDSKFGSLNELTNGLSICKEDGDLKRLALITNNGGFYEQGFVTEYTDKAGGGNYSFKTKKNYSITNGVAIRIDGTKNEMFRVSIRDNLTGLSKIVFIIQGHLVTG